MDHKGGKWDVMNWEIGSVIDSLLCIKQKTNENLLDSMGNSALCGDLNGKEIPKMTGYTDMHS